MNSQAEKTQSEAIDKDAQEEEKFERSRMYAVTWFTLGAVHMAFLLFYFVILSSTMPPLISNWAVYVSLVYLPLCALSFIVNFFIYLELLVKRK